MTPYVILLVINVSPTKSDKHLILITFNLILQMSGTFITSTCKALHPCFCTSLLRPVNLKSTTGHGFCYDRPN